MRAVLRRLFVRLGLEQPRCASTHEYRSPSWGIPGEAAYRSEGPLVMLQCQRESGHSGVHYRHEPGLVESYWGINSLEGPGSWAGVMGVVTRPKR